ncbi:MAG: TolC family protein [Chitinophagaceae bacterium]
MQRLNKIIAWIGLTALTLPVLAQEQHAFTIQQALDYAKKNNVQVKNALLDVLIQAQTNREVTGGALPQIKGSGSIVYNAKLPVSLVPAEFLGGTPGTFAELAFGTKWSSTGGVSISQVLFDGTVFAGLKARNTLISYQLKNEEITEETIRANVSKIYYQLLVSRTQIELLDSNISLVAKLQHDTKVMYDNGFAEKLDLSKLEVQQANLQTEKTNTLNQVANGYLGLKVLMGMPVKDSLTLTDTLNDEQVKEGIPDMSVFDYNQRRDFQASQMGIKLNEFDLKRYRAAKLPTLNLNGYYNKNAQRDQFNFLSKNGDWFGISAFTVNLSVPIFTGFSANARIARAKLVLQQSVNQQEALKINIDNEIQTASNNFKSAISNLDYQKKNMALAEDVYQQTKKKFEVGTGTQTEINQAQTDLKTAQTNYINSLYNAIIAKIDFVKATGKL